MAAGLAGHAEFQRIGHCIRCQRVGSQLAGNRQPQRVGPAPRDIFLVAGGAIRTGTSRRPRACAGAVVVAHLDAPKAAAGAG